jgi:hypothetical protein
MIKCNKCGHVFKEYALQSVFWSGEKIPVCPICSTDCYSGQFDIIEDTKKINRKDLIYRFLDLSFVSRITILKELDLFQEGDLDSTGAMLAEQALTRAEQRGCLKAFWEEVRRNIQ